MGLKRPYHVVRVLPLLIEESGSEITLAEAGNDADDILASHFWALGDGDGGDDGCTRRDAAQHAFLAREAAGHLDGRLAGDLDDLVVDGGVESVRNEAGAYESKRQKGEYVRKSKRIAGD